VDTLAGVVSQAKPTPLVRLLWRRGPLVLSVATFAIIGVQSGRWWWAALAGLVVNPVLPLVIGGVLGWRAGRASEEPKVFLPVRDIADDDRSRHCAAELRAAREALVRLGSARLEFSRDIDIDEPNFSRGFLARGLNQFAGALRHVVGEGVIDFHTDRVMLDYNSYAETSIGTQKYAGYSGGPLRPRQEDLGTAIENRPTPQWLIAVLGHITRAAEAGEDDTDGNPWRRFDVLVDLRTRVSDRPAMTWVPEWPDPANVPLVVWLEDSSIRQLRYQETAGTTYTLTLRDLGIDVSGLDWDRLGTFRTPTPNHDADPNLI
jgi:hypothetical protein